MGKWLEVKEVLSNCRKENDILVTKGLQAEKSEHQPWGARKEVNIWVLSKEEVKSTRLVRRLWIKRL